VRLASLNKSFDAKPTTITKATCPRSIPENC
jgi:hypothetical protein